MKILLSALRGLILVKRHGMKVVRPFVKPVSVVGRFLIRMVGVPAYRLVFFAQRQLAHVLLPAKNRILYLVSNRYAVHAAVIAIAAVASSANLSQTQVRAETFGSHSMLYALVAQGDAQTIEVVSATDTSNPDAIATSYMDDPAIDVLAHVDLDYAGESYVATLGGSIASPTLSEGSLSVAPRDAVEPYTVADGDTLGGISDQFGLSLSTLLWANNLTFRSTIRPGQSLNIPPVDGVLYTVKKGDSVNKIANTYGTDAAQIIAFNKLGSADDLRVGDELMLPGGEPPAPVVRPATKPLASLFTSPGGTAVSDAQGFSKWTPFAAPKGDGETSGTWTWPTDWHVITQNFGWKHTGVDLDGDYSTHSYAAADGVVIYSGWRTGYGNTVEIDHGNGVVTRYAHHSKLLVHAGDVVTAGQTIAITGSTGRSTGTHLHFEVIVNGKFQNPLNYVR
ncbi:M23 family metallopeptidase [bacterium]|nr:M23 family metallopeptidase [bacterium]